MDPSVATRLESMRPRLLATARRLGVSPPDAEDLVQQTLTDALEGLDDFEGGASVETWVYRIFLNRRADALRRRRAIPQAEGHVAPDALTFMISRERHDAIRGALADLPRPDESLLVWRFIEDRSYAEISAMEGVAEGTLRSQVFEALKRLRAALKEFE